MIRRKFKIKIDIECDSRAEYLEALKAIGRANGPNIECRAYVVVKSKGSRNADIRDLLNEPKGTTP